MADDWIPMRIMLASDPAVVAVALALDVDEDLIVGKLLRLWGWADQHTEDGNALRVTSAWIDRLVRQPNFADALARVGWLSMKPEGVTIPRFERWMGKSGKSRISSNRRVAEHRARETDLKRKRNAKCVTQPLPENRIEQNRIEEIPPSRADDGDGSRISEDANEGAELPEAITPTTAAKTHPKFAEVVREFSISTTLGPRNRATLNAMLEAFGVEHVRIGLAEARAHSATNPIPYADTVCNRLRAEQFGGRRKPTAASTPSRPSPDRKVVHE